MKYIIKNCPNYYYEANWEHPHRCNLTDGDWSCDVACTPDDDYGFNCLLKRIVEFVQWRDEESACNSCGLGIPHRKEEFQRILKMLEIEECE